MMLLEKIKSKIGHQIIASFAVIIAISLIIYGFSIFALLRVQYLQNELNTKIIPTLYQVDNISKDVIHFTQAIEALYNEGVQGDISEVKIRIQNARDNIEKDIVLLGNAIDEYNVTYVNVNRLNAMLFQNANLLMNSIFEDLNAINRAMAKHIKAIEDFKQSLNVPNSEFSGKINGLSAIDLANLNLIRLLKSDLFDFLRQLDGDINVSIFNEIQNIYTNRLNELSTIIPSINNSVVLEYAQELEKYFSDQLSADTDFFALTNRKIILQSQLQISMDTYRENQIALNNELLILLEELQVLSEEQASSVNYYIELSVIIFYTLVIVSVVATILIASYFLYPNIITRINRLSYDMHMIRSGNLDIEVNTDGVDEIAAMAKNLDNFRVAIKQRSAYHRAMENSVEGVSLIDADGYYKYVNSAFSKLFSYSINELIGEKWLDSYVQSCHQEITEALERLHTNSKIVIEVQGSRKHGTEFTARVTMIANYEKNLFVGHYCFVSDITEKVKAADKIKEATQFQALIKENIPDILFIKDEHLRIVDANEAFFNMFPTSQRNKIIGSRTIDLYKKVVGQDINQTDKLTLLNGETEVEETITFANGKTHIFLTKKVRFENSQKEKFILGLARDITQIKQTEKELLESNIELERYAYVASHDLQEPIRMVANFTSLLQKKYADKLDETAHEYINFAADGAKRMQQLIVDLLEYARFSRDDIEYKTVDVEDILELVKINLFQEIYDSSANIAYTNMPTIKTSPMLFLRLLQNILSNAVKYRKSNSRLKIIIRYARTKDMHTFSIEDNGIGMSPEYKEKIFEIFQRLHPKHEYSGTGIGLALCRKIIENLGGHISVDTELGVGTTFHFSLPINEAVNDIRVAN